MYLALIENSIQLVPDGTLFLHILLIIFMVLVLNATLFRPINRILEDREQRTHSKSTEAEKILRQVEAKLVHYEQSLRAARGEGYRLLEEQRNVALRERQSLLTSLREELQDSTEEQKHLIETQLGQVRATLESESRQVGEEIGRKILNRSVSSV